MSANWFARGSRTTGPTSLPTPNSNRRSRRALPPSSRASTISAGGPRGGSSGALAARKRSRQAWRRQIFLDRRSGVVLNPRRVLVDDDFGMRERRTEFVLDLVADLV